MTMYRLAVFVSGGGSNLQNLIDRIADGRLDNCQIVAVISSRADVPAVEKARAAGLSLHIVKRNDFAEQAEYDQRLIELMDEAQPDLIILAGFMVLLGAAFIERYPDRIINIHPSLLPSFGGKGVYGIRPHEAVLDYGCKISGATVHFVDTTYDTGPILLQKAIPVLPNDTPQVLQLRIREECEKQLLPQAVRLLAEGRVELSGRRARILEAGETSGARRLETAERADRGEYLAMSKEQTRT